MCLFCHAAENLQRITPGDGELEWTVHQEYSDGFGPIGDQFIRLTFTSDPITGEAVMMVFEERATSVENGILFDIVTEVPLSEDVEIIWRIALADPNNWFPEALSATTPASELIWSDHFGIKSTSVSLSDPTINSYAVWCDWKKAKGTVTPRVTFGSQPAGFNNWLSNGLHNP